MKSLFVKKSFVFLVFFASQFFCFAAGKNVKQLVPMEVTPVEYRNIYLNWNNEQPFAGVTQRNFIEELTGKSIVPQLTNIRLISAALWAWLSLLSFVITIKNKRYKNLLILVPALLNWGTLMIATPIAFTLRYVYILVLMVPLTIFVPIMKNKEEAEKRMK